MAKILFDTLELSDIKKVVEQALEEKLKEFIQPKESSLVLLTRKDTAQLLKISLPTLGEWTKNGTITAYRIGNRVLYKLNEVDEALERIRTVKAEGGWKC